MLLPLATGALSVSLGALLLAVRHIRRQRRAHAVAQARVEAFLSFYDRPARNGRRRQPTQ